MDNKPGTNKSVLEIPINNFTDIMNIQIDYNDTIPTYKQVDLTIKTNKDKKLDLRIDMGKFYGYNNLYMPPKKNYKKKKIIYF